MSDYSVSIKKLNDELLAFINRYEILDEKDPISNTLLKRLRKQINSLNTTSNQYVAGLSKQLKNFDDRFKSISETHQEKEKEIQMHLTTSLEVINTKYVKKINELNEEINKLKAASEEKLSVARQDIEYFIISSKQRENIFEREYEENIKRYDYQIAMARETYNQSIKTYNTQYEKEDKALDESYASLLKNFDESTEQLVNRLNSKIIKANEELEEVSKKLQNIRNQMKEKFRQESIFLNNEIQVLVEEKNKTIVNARTRYTKSQNASAMEKENKRQEYQLESQGILKDFVYNISELDEYTGNYKLQHKLQLEKEQRQLHYHILKLYKKQNTEITAAVDNGYAVNGEYDKYTKYQIRLKNKLYYKLQNQAKRTQLKKLKSLELLFQKELEKTRHNKALLDLDKTYGLKVLTEKEQSDNKYYQEMNNIYENDMNLLIQIANMKYNQKANLVKCQSRIRNKGMEKDLDISEANFQKKIEMIQTSINKYKFEIDGALKLKDIVHKYEENCFLQKKNYLTVSSLLEIEKCKVLDQYNRRQYEHNTLNSKTNLVYGKKKLELENEKFETLTNIEIEKIKSALQRDVINAAYKIKEDQIYEAEDKQIQNRNTQYEIDSINHTVLYERFKAEIKIIHQILSTFILLVRELETFSFRILSMFFNSINVRPEYLDIIKIFVNDFLKIINAYYSNLISNLNEQECEVIYKRIEFEERFKFKTYYNDLLSSYEADRKRLLTKRKSITDTLENYTKTVDTFRSRLYNLQNQNNLIKQKLNSKQAHSSRADILKELNSNHQKITDYEKKIEDILKFKRILGKDNLSLSNELKLLEKEYNHRIAEIKKMQYNSAISFYDLRRNLSKYSSFVIQKTTAQLDKQAIPIKYFDFHTLINDYKNNFTKSNSAIFKEFYEIINIFYQDTYTSIEKDKRLLLIKFKHDIAHIYAKTTVLIEENQKEYDKKVSTYIQELKTLKNQYQEEEKKYKDILQENDERYQEEIKLILQKKKESLNRFYTEFYAMCDNLTGIKTNYKTESRNRENRFQRDKMDLTKTIISEKTEVSENLENFIKAKEELINHLPTATKFQSQQLHKETREINAGIENEIKQVKAKFNIERKNIQKNISNIHSNLEQTLLENETKHQKDIMKEKKNHIAQTRHLEKNITGHWDLGKA